MSEESISHREDKENLLYITRKLKLEEFQLGEDLCQRESATSSDSNIPTRCFESDINLCNTISKQIGPEASTDPELIAKTKPFDFLFSYGINSKTGIINLTTEDRKEVFFSSSNLPILYNYCTRQMKCLEGHQYTLSSISTDKTGQWLVTADDNPEGCIIVWDSFDCRPVYTWFNVYPISGTLIVKFSESARYLITIGVKTEGTYSVDFWLWTLGIDKPNDTYEINKSYGLPIEVCFNPNIEEFIMIICKKQVFLLVWDTEEKQFCNPKVPQILHPNKIGILTAGTYISDCHECYVCSMKGRVLCFANTLYSRPFEEGELDNSKIYINSVKVSQYPLRSCAATINSLVIGDASGTIMFFDKTIKILYWFKNFSLASIVSISFHLIPKFRYEDSLAIYTVKGQNNKIFECDYSDMVDELETVYKANLPKDASLKNNPFLVNDFFIATSDNNLYGIDFLNKKCVPIFMVADDYVSAIETHDELSYIVIGYANGRLHLVDYEKNELVCSIMLPRTDDYISISCLKYSPQSLHLVCGRENGEIWILEPIVLEPKSDLPFRPTKNKVMKIVFSKHKAQFAYYDNDKTVVLFEYHTGVCEWKFAGKVRSHYDDINDIIFMPTDNISLLFTISADRHLVEYNNNNIDENEFTILCRERVEQKAIPVTFMYWYDTTGDTNCHFFLIADSEHKLKLIDAITKIPKTIVLGPAFGCFKNQHIRKMAIIPKRDERYMVFLTNKHIGLHILPPDGNPYKYVGYLGHPTKVMDFVLSPDGKYVFTFGAEDYCIFKWKIRTRAVELMHLLGGKELEPFYCLIEGGKNGWLFQEIKDLFYYMQILQQETVDFPRRVTDMISVSELPELLENMMMDIKYRNFHEGRLLNTEVSFIDFVKLFCNHKPAYGYSKEQIKDAFETIARNSDSSYEDEITRENFTSSLAFTGELISTTNLEKFFKTLLRSDDSGGNFEFLPDIIDFDMFYEEILGIDMGRTNMMDEQEDESKETKKLE